VWFTSIKLGALTTFLKLFKELCWLAHQQFFWHIVHASTSLEPQLQNRNKCTPLNFTFSVYIHGSWTIWDRTQVLLGASWGTHLGTLGRTWWESLRTREKTQKIISPGPSKKKTKNWIVHECMLSRPISCMKPWIWSYTGEIRKKIAKKYNRPFNGGGGWGSESHKTIINFGGKLSFILSLLCPKRLPVQLL
jgi:hypothetical protein